MQRVCVFCGSSPGHDPVYVAAARELGTVIAARGIGLVYGGASVGLMGALADAVLAAGGEVIGVLPRALDDREIAHRGLTELRIVTSMHERKAQMAELADAFIALPGGLGTLEELFEAWTWSQLGLHQKACGILNVLGFFTPLLGFLDHATAAGFIRPSHRDVLRAATEPGALLDELAAYRPPPLPKWLNRDTI
jgi:uncharacterized protein (TIGR00730 family)